MEKQTEPLKTHHKESKTSPNFSKPIWKDQDMSCGLCDYNGQDIDTYPCAKCHTRH